VADAGNRRILRLNKDGSFVRQFRAADDQAFAQIRGVFVDEAASQPKLFVVSENVRCDALLKCVAPPNLLQREFMI